MIEYPEKKLLYKMTVSLLIGRPTCRLYHVRV